MRKYIAYLIVIIALIVTGYYFYQRNTAQTVTTESQVQAETTQGVKQAADNAKVTMLQEQLDSATKQIAELKNQKPETIIKTVPYEVEKIVVKEVEKRGADFAIVTDPTNPDKAVDLKEVANLPASTDVTLNQYNVFAYKKVLRDITIYPSFSGITPNGIDEVDYGVSRKITKSGKYLGVVAGYEFDDKKTKIGLRYTF